MSCMKSAATIAAVAVIASHALAEPALGQGTPAGDTCTCQVPLPEQNSVVGFLSNETGNVTVTQPAGPPSKGVAPVPLLQASRVSVGAQSSALFVAGPACTLHLPQNTQACFVPAGESLCVRVVDTGTQCGTVTAQDAIRAIAIGGGIIGAGSALAVGLGKRGVSD